MRLPRVLGRLAALFRVYDATEADAARFRARQLQGLLAITPALMAVNVLNAIVIAIVLWSHAPHALLLGWGVVIVLLASRGLHGWLRSRRAGPRATASRRAVWRATLQAGLMGLAWAVLPATLFPLVEENGRFFVGTITVGMICGGGFALFTLPGAGTTFVLLVAAGGLLGLARADQWTGSLLMLALFTTAVVYAVWAFARTFAARLLAEARADQQAEVIGLLLRDFEDHTSDVLWEIDAGGRFVRASRRLAERLGVPRERLRRLRALALLRRLCPPGEEARRLMAALRRRLREGGAMREQMVALRAGDDTVWWALTARPLLDAAGVPAGWRGVAADVTERQLAHRRLSWMAHNDALTGLGNRASFREALQAQLQADAGRTAPLAVLVMDLDGFKQVNDGMGHAAGDALLQAFARRLQTVARRSDGIARLGGDEFALLALGTRREADLEPLLQRLLAALAEPVQLQGRPLQLRSSIGVALAPADGDDVDALMNHADAAMYEAKRQGGNRWAFYHAGLAETTRRRVLMQQALRGAVERGEFRLAFQPQVCASSGRLRGFEALLRWCHPELGEVEPAEFIGIAESAGLMHDIGRWVMAEACRHAAGWPPELSVAINLSATQLGASDLVERIEAAAGAIAPQRIELEVTESALVDDIDNAVTTLQALRRRGYRIGLDDFGTGYSALGYLRRFQFDTLKIDRSFVQDLSRNDGARVIVDTILAMARALQVIAVAEGVETERQADMLRERGCELLQGFLFSRPLAAAEIQGFLAQQDALAAAALP
ncbi:putative bifunctional diguanylate cyclase/phosphodiesterase [Pseudorhodoferax sp.]|uniref:putative bifunctional diguanylate cyclase/phosphodiesterase n=1 Tax=Pseudorhodoferax sp. TaxID=1993553 RepID=UPI0039E33B30